MTAEGSGVGVVNVLQRQEIKENSHLFIVPQPENSNKTSYTYRYKGKGKGKVTPLQARCGPEGG
jgi:hypothetical protein